MQPCNDMLGDYSDTERLDWVMLHGMFRVQGDDQHGWRVLDMRNGLTFLVERKPTMRDAIDTAMNLQKEGKIRQYDYK